MTFVIAVVGYPGSGKSVAKEISEKIGYNTITMGDYVRKKTREDWNDELKRAKQDQTAKTPSDVFGDYATHMRDKHGQGVVAEWCKEEVNSSKNPVFLDGIRSPKSYYKFKQFSNIKLLFIHAPASLRLDWIKDRARDSEETFDAVNLLNRDQKENSWGLNELINNSDHTIHNCESIDIFRDKVREYLYSEFKKYRFKS